MKKNRINKFLHLTTLLLLTFSFTGIAQNLSVGLSGTPPTCSDFTDGEVLADITGGTAPYTIMWNTGSDGLQVSGGGGDYSITVTDADGMTASNSFNLQAPAPIEPVVTLMGDACTDGGMLQATVTGGMGAYTYAWPDGSTGTSIDGLGAGLHCVTVTDGNGCGGVGCLQVSEGISVTLSVIDVTCFNGCDASIEATVMGGVAPYSYAWSNGAPDHPVNENLPFGTYSVTVTDGNGCTASATINAGNGSQVEVSITAVNPNCDVGALGSATATASGGAEPYTYNWSNGAMGATANDLAPGTYSVTATDANGCQGSESVVIEDIGSFTVSITPSFVCGNATGSATVTVMGGATPFTYTWSNGQSTATATDLLPNTNYTVTVMDANGCTGMTSVLISSSDDVVVDLSSTNPACNGELTGSINATVTGGTAPYNYLWSSGQTTPSIANLGVGTYSLTVSDANGCGGSASVTISQPEILGVTVSTTDATCDSPSSGSATTAVTGGTAPYSYEWNNGATDATLSNLGSGGYMVIVTDANGCTTSDLGTILASSDLSISAAGTDVSCGGAADGSASVTVSGGAGNYTYAWSNGETTATITGLNGGTYDVTVSENGCSGTSSVTINEPTAVTVSAIVSDASCLGADASADATASGGTGPYTYAWSNGDTDGSIDGLAAGTYTVTATDANACTATTTVSVSADGLVVSVSGTDVACAGDATGSATASPSGGTAPYTYEWNNNQSGASISNLVAAGYNVTVTDANGCVATGDVLLSSPSQLQLNASSTNITCGGMADGTANISVSGGTSPYSYSWSNGSTNPNISNLGAGSYTITVTDANACIATTTISVSGADGLVVSVSGTDVTCASDATGSATASVNGGTAPYTYEWNNNQNGASISNLVAAGYTVTVTDANGCVATGDVLLSSPSQLQLNASSTNITCGGMADGTANISVSGGTVPYAYSWSNGSTNPNISNLGAGSYTVTVTDANGCIATRSITVSQVESINISLTPTPTCEGQNDGTVSVSVSGGSPAYNYIWSNGASGTSISNLSSGNYGITVTDGQGCVQTASATVQALGSPVVAITVDQAITMIDGNEGILTAVASGTGPFTYAWSSGQSTATISNLSAGTYSVTVTNPAGCVAVATESLNAPPPAKVGNFVWNDQNRNGIQDPGEHGIAGILVRLDGTDAMGNTVISGATTDDSGFYLIDNLNPGTYKLTFKSPTSYDITISNQGENDALDSDINPNGMTNFFTLSIGECNLDMDGGFYDICVNLTNPGAIAADQTLCSADEEAATIISVTDPSGGQGDLEIIWMKNEFSDVPFSDPSWEIIPGATGLTYNPGRVAVTTYFARCARRNGCSPYHESNLVKISVTPVVPIIIADDEICVNTDFTFAAAPNGADAVYTWNFGADATPSTATGQFAAAQWSTTGNKTVELTITRNGCSGVATKVVRVDDHVSICGGHLASDNEGAVLVYPNPAASNTILRVAEAFTTDAAVQILNSQGRVMMSTTWLSGSDQLEVDLSNQPAGMYFVRIQRTNEAPALIRMMKK